MNIKDFSLDQLLELLLSENNLFYTLTDNNVLKVSYLKTKSFYIDYVNFSKVSNRSNKTISTGASTSSNSNGSRLNNSTNSNSGGGNGSDSTTLDFVTEFKFWDNIKSEIESILNREGDSFTGNKTIINQEAGVITVTGTKKQTDRIEKYIQKITSRLHKQILIDAKIIEVTYDDDQTTGINWSKFQASLKGNAEGEDSTILSTLGNPASMLGYKFDMEGLIKFLKTQGDVSIVSNPKILTLNNQPAIINVGEEKNYKYTLGTTTTTTNGVVQSDPQFQVGSTFVGVTLGIIPEVTQNNHIILKINPIVSEISKNHIDANGNPNLAPDIKVKQLSSIIKVKNNQQVIIGGLIQKRVEDKTTKVPLLGDIPLLGLAFKSKVKVKSKSELIIVMTPKLITGDKSTPSLGELERGLTHHNF
jgi:general secretion pathway protein D